MRWRGSQKHNQQLPHEYSRLLIGGNLAFLPFLEISSKTFEVSITLCFPLERRERREEEENKVLLKNLL